MAEDRRYDEGEIAEILELATSRESSPAAMSPGAGMTLSQLQEIGSEVGIPPGRIAEAARAVSAREVVAPSKTFLGAPRSVSRTVKIPRALSDDEWTRLVVDLRQTFDALGKVTTHGSLRSWTNGNLQVHVEPDDEGYRVRMRTVKGSIGPLSMVGLAFVMVALIFLTTLAGGYDAGVVAMAALFGGGGLAQLGYARLSLPGWADERAAQMEGLAERIPRLLED